MLSRFYEGINRYKEILLLLIVAVASTLALWFSETSEGGADALVHYGMAKGSWKHPDLFLDLWGKPLFTFLSSPFAQGGMKTHQLFNVIIGAFCSFLTWKTAERMGFAKAWLAIPLLAFFPVWFPLSFSTMTEPLFACLLILAVYFYVGKREMVSALVVSFLPFARQEGFSFILLFLILFLITNKWRAIPALLVGSLVFSIIGLFYFGDFLWLLHNQPYHADDQTTPGGPLHYLLNYEGLFGMFGSLLILVGSLWFLKEIQVGKLKWFLLIVGGFWMILAAHSYIYFRGQAGSIGLLRLLATVAPLGALLALAGFEWVDSWLKKPRDKIGALILLLILHSGFTFFEMDLPLKNDPLKNTLIDFAKTIPQDERATKKIYSTDPQLWFYLDRDYWDKEAWVAVNHAGHYKEISKGSLFIVENMFGHWFDVEEFAKRENVKLRSTFYPKEELTFGHGLYCIYVFDIKE